MAKKKKIVLSKNYNSKLIKFSNKNVGEIFSELNSSEKGLNKKNLDKNINRFGTNKIKTEKAKHWYNFLYDGFVNPFSLILLVIAVLNIGVPENNGKWFQPDINSWISFSVIMSIVLISGIIKIFQEYRSSKSANKLKEMIKVTTAIERDGVKKEIPIDQVVVGDIVHLAAGDMIPADIRIIYSKDLFINQSSLTGESEPIEKFSSNKGHVQNALECQNMCFMGTNVANGSGKGIVVSTGQDTYFGKIAKSINRKKPQTNFDKGIKSVSFIIIISMIIMSLLVFILKGLLGNEINPWINALLFSLATAIGIVPEMLPMIVTLNLAREAFRLSKQKTIVKNINSIQSFGAMDVLCTDKTGTLTEDKVILERHLNLNNQEDNRVLVYAYLNSYYQTGLKNLLDLAIISKSESVGFNDWLFKFNKIDEIPFDFKRRRMTVVLQDSAKEIQIVTKGAIEEVISSCTCAEIDGKTVKLNQELINKIKANVTKLNKEGMRVIAIATNSERITKVNNFTVADESNLKLVGYVAFLDPPKASAAKAVNSLLKRGVNIKILTGDNGYVAKHICDAVGVKSKKILLGDDVENMSDEQLKKQVEEVNIFAKLSPEQKARIVLILKSNKHVVGYMGDGINDASAMKVADIGISVDTAVDIAKDTSDVILLEKDLTILDNCVVEGRKTFANIMKYIKISVSSNFGNILSVLVATMWLRFNPIAPTQILILNMINEFGLFSIPWDSVDDSYIEKPQDWKAKEILKFMLFIGPISSIFDITFFLIMYFGFNWQGQTDLQISLFNTSWFLLSVLTQISIFYILRTKKIPIFQSSASAPVTLTFLCFSLVGFIFALTPGLENIGFVSLATHSPEIIGYVFCVLAGYCLVGQLGKTLYIKKFNTWI